MRAAPLAGTLALVLAFPGPHLAALEPDHGRGAEDAVLGLLEHVLRRARLVVVALAQPAGTGELAPIEAEAVKPLAAEMIIDVLHVGAVGGDGEVAALLRRPRAIGRGEMKARQPV